MALSGMVGGPSKWRAIGKRNGIAQGTVSLAESLGAEYEGRKAGLIGDVGCFSFFANKVITTGEGGMITTKNKMLADKLRQLRSHGIIRDPAQMSKNDGPWFYEMQYLGFNYRLPDINCALGISQLKRIEKNLARRQEISQNYRKELAQLPIQLPYINDNIYHAYHLFVIQVDQRLELFNFLKARGIHSQIHYIPIHTQPYYRNLYGTSSFPVSEKYYSRCLSLPMYHGMTHEEQTYVIDQLKAFYAK